MPRNFSNNGSFYKIQEFKRQKYKIPNSYREAFKKLSISEEGYIYLLYCLQFGGFLLKENSEIPSDIENFFEIKKEQGHLKISSGEKLLDFFQDISRELLEVDFSRILKLYSDKDNFGGEKYSVLYFREVGGVNYLGFTKEEVISILDFVKKFNDFTQKNTRITAPNLSNGLSPQFLVQYFYNFYSNPFFKVSFKSGGRLYAQGLGAVKGSSYQSLKGIHRRKISLNGEGVKELDIKSSILQFFVVLCQKYGIVLDNSFLRGIEENDPYDFIKNEYLQGINIGNPSDGIGLSLEREQIKNLVLRILYNDKEKREQSIKYYLGKRLRVTHSILSNMGEIITKVDELIDKLDGKMPLYRAINHEEAQFFYAVADELMSDGISVLPVHDSYIVGESNLINLEKRVQNISKLKYSKILQYKEK